MIICCGEALIDMIPRECDGKSAFVPYPGGSIFNTAIALGRLGAPCALVSGISDDFFGCQLIETLKASHVSTDYCVRSDRASTLAFVQLADGQAQYCFFDEASAGRMLQPSDLPVLPPSVSALHFGAISLIGEPCGHSYEDYLKRHHNSHVISLDPNIRPGFIKDGAAHRARLLRMIAMTDILKISDEDLSWLDDSVAPEQAGAALSLRGPSLIVVTRGARGAIAFFSGQSVEVKAPKVDIADTVGAGDTFNAGLLTGLKEAGLLCKEKVKNLNPGEITAALELATRASAEIVTRIGANPPWRHEI